MSRTFALLSLSACLAAAPAGLHAQPLDTVRPIVMVASDLNPIPGETVTYTIMLSAPATASGYFNISASSIGNFGPLPMAVGYNAGDTSVSFSGTLLLSAFGNMQVTASNASGAVSVVLNVSTGSVADALVASARF